MNNQMICMTRLFQETNHFQDLIRNQEALHEPLEGGWAKIQVRRVGGEVAMIEVFECQYCHCLIPI